MSSLFRENVVSKKTQNINGEVALIQPLRLTITIFVFLIVVAVSLYAATTLQYGVHHPVTGWFKSVPEIQELVIEKPGVLKSIHYKNGDFVKKGDVISVVEHPEFNERGEFTHIMAIERAKRRLKDIKSQYHIDKRNIKNNIALFKKNMKLDNQELTQLKSSIQVSADKHALVEKQIDRLKYSFAEGHISELELDKGLQEELTSKQALNDLKMRAIATQKSIIQREEQLLSSEREYELLEIIRDEKLSNTVRERELSEQAAYTVTTALTGGVIHGLKKSEGEIISQDAVLYSVLPSEFSWSIELMLPTNLSAQIKEGDPVKVAVSAFPYQTYGHLKGVIGEIETNVTKSSNVSSLGTFNQPSYKATVHVTDFMSTKGKMITPQNGLNVTANIITEKETVISKILKPFKDIGTHFYD